jgi:hypothetical protein
MAAGVTRSTTADSCAVAMGWVRSGIVAGALDGTAGGRRVTPRRGEGDQTNGEGPSAEARSRRPAAALIRHDTVQGIVRVKSFQ